MLIPRSLFAVIPPITRDSSILPTFSALKAVHESEKSIKFLLKNEFLHEFGLLDSSRSIVARSTIPSSSSQSDPQPAPPSEPTLQVESTSEAALVKCSGPVNTPALPPFAEGEEETHREGKEIAAVNLEDSNSERTINDAVPDDGQDADQDNETYIYDDLEDLAFTRKELMGDLLLSSKLTSPAVQTLQNTPPIPPVTREVIPAVQTELTPVTQSGS